MEFKKWWDQASAKERLELLRKVKIHGTVARDYERWADRNFEGLSQVGGISHSTIEKLEKALVTEN